MTLQATFAATLVDEWVRGGVTDAVVSPGSRSTPLALALAANEWLRVHVILDERSAGFFALGLAQASGRPAVALTTSGTAAAELHAAVVEAHQARVPLIVCTADRPPDLHGISAPQTIVQRGLYGEAVRWFAEPGVVEGLPMSSWRSMASRSVAEAVANVTGPGPVHLNLAFRDPLVAEPGPLPEGRVDSRPWHRADRSPGVPARELATDLHGRRGVIVAGRRCGRTTLHHLAAALQWPVLADPRSQARGGPCSVAAFDGLLRSPGFVEAHPVETVLRLGEPPASKVLSQWLAGLVDAEQIVVDPYGRWPDPERRSDRVVHADPTAFCGELMDAVHPAPAGWLTGWLAAEAAAQMAIERVLAAHDEATEPGVARALTASLASDVSLFVSSSMPIRDVEWFGHPTSAHRVLANRGANGIDGIVSSALGVAASGVPTVCLLGDLAFLYDAGGLLGATGRGLSCTFVVIDNGGGGIFSFLPQAGALPPDRFEQLFGTPQSVDIVALAGAHGVQGVVVDAASELVPAVERSLSTGGVGLVVVRTDRVANVAVHDELHAAVAATLGG
ncbi:MAG TPA: 2-succinyl-5-enolpyruvyl-6-hydroxy-3-cyclohexene-1-carboxylic-acid synthase [Acidimicrobiales bacterium]|nr:2-succinyl-5-enolpyruvyl-6-hydroxy-3-cyclohexene-1-carboxylic-acid synthase [Acidimicrobiales bacterium]